MKYKVRESKIVKRVMIVVLMLTISICTGVMLNKFQDSAPYLVRAEIISDDLILKNFE